MMSHERAPSWGTLRPWTIAGLMLALVGFGCGPEPEGDASFGGTGLGTVEQAAVVCADDETLFGIDVSYYQGDIDWSAVAADDIAFAITRTNHGGFLDPKFAVNWQEIAANGLVRGAYQYFDPGGDPVEQANVFIDHVGTLQPGDLPGVIDVESTDGQSAAIIAANVQTWVDLVEAGTGRRPIIYTGQYFWNDNVGTDQFSEYPLWLAQYLNNSCPDLPTAWSAWRMWQYTGSGSVDGINGNVDRNHYNGSWLRLNDFAGNGYRAEVVAFDYPAQMAAGALLEVTLTLENLGARSWDDGTFLATSEPRDRDSEMAAASWVNARRVVSLGEVASGDTVEITFEVRAPSQPGLYSEHFNLVQEGVAWFSDLPPGGGPADDVIRLDVAVQNEGDAVGVGSGAGAGGSGASGGIPSSGPEVGCSVGRAPGSSSWGWTTLLALALLRRRRQLCHD